MNKVLFRIIISTFVLSLAGCSSSITRENSPDKFDLINTGTINRVKVSDFKNCLIKGFEVKNRIAYNVQTRHKLMNDGHRIESYGGETFLLLSVDISNSGKTKLLRVQNSSLTDLSKQISSYETCLNKYSLAL